MKNTPQKNQNKNIHTPVMLEAVLEYLNPSQDDSYLDLTAGYGGHASAVLKRTKNPSQAVLIDRDQSAIDHLKDLFGENGAKIIKSDYLGASKVLETEEAKFDLVLADLGVSSQHINQTSRGFSFSNDGPLDMRMDQDQELDAHAIVNRYSESKLASVIKSYGEEPKASKIAHLIVINRPITSTKQLASIVKRVWPIASKKHPATRTFQAIRIEVNDELTQLKESLPIWINLLKPGGRIVVISFHSLEDAAVKAYFRELSGKTYDAELSLLTKHPVSPQYDEIVKNPRARSAKLRAAVKINKKGGV
ncbi:MAG TPA: 16S rRNA (cytosine(1402)-N(4))-methyltransferase RsmH [Candidatus Saccharimonadales bacterium]|nr:16S rRNA (cytosine(1402)-N(4))-methyltransferase RsmH [Candidatus Saccharimonadales bacterium]